MDKAKRLASLDTFRGIDMLMIMGAMPLIVSICLLFPGGENCWLAVQMSHAEWNGLHICDLIFPTFLFIAGISFPFSYAKQLSNGYSRAKVYRKIFVRFLALFILGCIFNGIIDPAWEHFRFFSVLSRIGLAWMIAAILYINLGPRWRTAIVAVILLGYWGLCNIPAPDIPGADPLSMEGCLVGYVDRCLFPGHLYCGFFDPEGLLSAVPAIVTAMLGMFTGEFIRGSKINNGRKTLLMLSGAVILIVAGLIWSMWFPINKQLWTSSFVLVGGGIALFVFAILYWIIDVKGHDGWILPFKVIGMNSITIYMAQMIVNFRGLGRAMFGGFADLCPQQVAAVIDNAVYVAICWLFLYFLYRKKIFLKV